MFHNSFYCYLQELANTCSKRASYCIQEPSRRFLCVFVRISLRKFTCVSKITACVFMCVYMCMYMCKCAGREGYPSEWPGNPALISKRLPIHPNRHKAQRKTSESEWPGNPARTPTIFMFEKLFYLFHTYNYFLILYIT